MSTIRPDHLVRICCFSLAVVLGILTAGCDGGSKLGSLDSPDGGKNTAGGTEGNAGSVANPVPVDPRYKQTFAEATRSEPPAEFQRPADLTLTRKSVGKLYSDLVALWPTIDLVGADGKLIPYVANLETDVGPIEITCVPTSLPITFAILLLWPDWVITTDWYSNEPYMPNRQITQNRK